MKIKIISAIWLMVLCSGISWSQVRDKTYVFKSINEHQGLSNNHVLAIFKDRLGFVWFGTAYGLNRFDGTRMKTFFTIENDSTSLLNNYTWKIFEGPEGNLWIKDINSEFSVYLLEQGYFSRSINLFSQHYKLKSDHISMVTGDQMGRYWFAHPEEGISVHDPQTGTTVYLHQNSSISGGLSFNQISYLAEGPTGEMWVVYQNGAIDVLNTQTLSVTQRMNLHQYVDRGRMLVWEMMVDSSGKAWVYTPNNNFGIFIVDPLEEKITHLHEGSQPVALNNNLVKSIIEKENGEYWIGTDHGGINVLKNDGTIIYVRHNADEGTGLDDNTVYSMYIDDNEIVWIGTYKKGVNFYHDGMMRFVHIKKSNLDIPKSLPYNDINVFAEDAKGNLYIGTNGDGLYYFDRQSGAYHHYFAEPGNPNSLSGNVVIELKIDHDGILWIGTYLHGLSSFDGKRFKNYSHNPRDPNSLSDVNVWSIHIDKKNRVWIGTLRGGLNLYDREQDNFRRFHSDGSTFPFNNQYVSTFLEDDLGNIWVGGGYGIDVINPETKDTQYYSAIEGQSGLSGNNITHLYKDSKGVIWASTSQGLNYFDVKSGKFMSFSKKDGLPTDYLISILEDENNNLWISSQNGLSYVTVDRGKEPYKLSFRNFDVSDGLQARLFNKNASLKTRDGEMLFGGPNGYNIFKTSNFAFSLNQPKVVFTELQLFNRPVLTGEEVDGRVILERNISNTDKIVLKHFQNIFSIDFTALNYINFEKNKFRYRLEGLNSEWAVLDEPPFRVTYTNLDPGQYSLVVQAAQHDGQWSPDEKVMTIQILAPFWKTPSAYFIYFLIVVLAAVLARRNILAKERENFKRLEEKREAQRILELDQLKTRFFTNVSHEFRTPLTLILAPLEKLLSRNPSEEDARQYLTIQKNAKRLLHLVNQILDIKNIEKNGIAFNPSDGDLVRYIETKVHDFVDLSEKKHIRLNFTTAIKRLPTKFDADKVEKIIFNLLSNAFKFTPNEGRIDVSLVLKDIKEGEGLLEISIRDSGVGIKTEDIPKIFERYYTAKHPREISNQGSGIGLSVAREFAKIHGGDIQVSSIVGQGSEFKVSLMVPVQRKLGDFELSGESCDLDAEIEVAREKDQRPGILLVEDNLEFRQYLKEFLEEEFNVWLAQDGKEGLEKAISLMPDLIISDLMMPVMDGVELCQEVKKDLKTSHIPVIILTARSSEEKQLEGLQSGCNMFITKPFKLEILMTSIRNLLKERERLQKHFRKKISVNTSEQEIESMDDRLIQKAMQVVESQMENPEFSVELMSRELGMSRVHLYKKLSALTGKSPVEFIRLVRLQRAAQLLLKSQLSVSEVAYKVGFNNAKYFTKQFKAEFGVLPSQYAGLRSVKEEACPTGQPGGDEGGR